MEKKHFFNALLISGLLLWSTSLWGYSFEVDGLYYSIISSSDLTCKVTYLSYKSTDNKKAYSGEIVIPQKVSYQENVYDVIEIDSYAFYECSNLTKVTIPESITSIGDYAFYDCSSLTEVNYNAIACTKAGSSNYPVFYYCTKLKTVNIGDDVTQIPDYLFYMRDYLKTLNLGKNIKTIGNYSFYHCGSMAVELDFSENLISIGKYAFYNCISITSVNLGNSVTTIGDYAFSDCYGLASLTIGSDVTEIGDYAFYDCTKLCDLTYNSIECKSAGSSSKPAFNKCTKINNITIGEGVKSIPNYTFKGCSNLTRVVLLNTTPPTLGGNSVFDSNDIEIEVPLEALLTYLDADKWSNITAIYAVKNGKNYYPIQICCEGNSIIKFKDGNEYRTIVSEEDGAYIFPKDGKDNLLGKVMYNGKNLTAALIGEGICSFEVTKYHADNVVYSYYVDSDQEYDVSLSQSGTLADVIGVNNINNVYSLRVSGDINGSDILAIRKYPNLKYLDISHANIVRGGSAYYDTYETYYDEVGDYFFYDLTNLNLLKLPDSATSIGKYAFASCSKLFCINISSSATSIGAFAFQGCSGLIGINAKNATPPAVATGDSKPYDTNPFGAINVDNCVLNVPIGSGSAYWLDTYWGVFYDINEVDFDHDATGIDDILASDETSTLGGDILIYDILGRRVNTPIKGNVYIFRYPNSSTKKVLVE